MTRKQLASIVSDLTWHVAPADQGQIVEYAYASDRESHYWRRVTDRSDGSVEYARLAFEDEDSWEDEADGFQPWNGLVPQGQWEDEDEFVDA